MPRLHVEINVIPTADLMKKGLRPPVATVDSPPIDSNRRPDEEGIKTRRSAWSAWRPPIPTADLMKKGLRRRHVGTAHLMLGFQPQT